MVIGAPKKIDEAIAEIEWRKFKPGGKLAVSPILSHDFSNKVTGLQLPVYFLPSDKGLTGGVRAGLTANWDPAEGESRYEFTVGVFVGVAALSILP